MRRLIWNFRSFRQKRRNIDAIRNLRVALTSVDATNLDAQNYQSSAADYRKCVAAYPNDPKVCEGRRLIMETNQRALNMMTTPVSDTMAKRP